MFMDSEEFECVAREALEGLPEDFRPYLDNCELVVESWPSQRLLMQLGLPPNALLFGLYRGVPVTSRQRDQVVAPPSTIYLFRESLLERCATRRQLIRQIQKTVLHEVGHHFGFDEDRLRQLGYG